MTHSVAESVSSPPASQSDGVGGDIVGRRNDSASAPNVVVSGWQVYDNKGRVVEKYEPFFASGWDYAPPIDDQYGQKVTMYYDALGRVIRTVNPDGSEQRVIYGYSITLMILTSVRSTQKSSRPLPGKPTPTTPMTTPVAPMPPLPPTTDITGILRRTA